MQGNIKVIEQLNNLLRNELAARDQYFTHSRIYDDMGLTKLFQRIDHEKDDETGHADMLIKRLLFFGETPDLSEQAGINIGSTVPEMLQSDLDFEYKVIADLKTAIAVCEEEKDYHTREILMVILDDTEEDHAHWLEKQLKLINLIGLSNYTQSQM